MNRTHTFRILLVLLTNLLCIAQVRSATVTTFTGGDPGEGLDLQGNFTYAVNVGPSGAAGKVGDATFTADNVAGVSITANNNIGNGGWGAVNYGTNDNDKNLSLVMDSIRWAAAPTVVTVKLKVEKGAEYKLQILFHEDCCPGRGFNIVINGTNEITNFMPGPTQNGGDPDPTTFAETKNKIGSVITHQFVAPSDDLEIVLDGPSADSADITDHNAILNGFTLERLTPVTDIDNDGLRDDWEKKFFGNLDQGANDDSDKDGLTNLQEQTLGTDPTKPDTDGDGLSDGDEVNKYKSDPLKTDSDGDSLSDGFEVNVVHTDPSKTDSDGDGTSDGDEVALGTDPADKNSKPILTTVGVFTGGDAGEGLDLDGTFLYALAIGADPGAFVPVKVRDAEFQALVDSEVTGTTLQAEHQIVNWYGVNYGDTDNDKNLATATSSIRWSDYTTPDDPANSSFPQVILTLENLEVGGEYKVQLMFGEECCNRSYDVLFDDVLVLKDFNPGKVQGGIANHKQEALITRLHFAKNTTLVIRLDGRKSSAASGSDHNAILNAVSVEKLAGKADTDNDGLPDAWEMLYFGNLSQDGAGDPDKDGLSNADEYARGTDPNLTDTDRDGLSDSEEKTAGTDPLSADTDGDGLKDGDEIKVNKTDPLKADSDGDGLSDGAEVLTYLTNPLKADTDGDGLDDGKEVGFGSDPLKTEPATQFSNIAIQSFSGGDPGEGLDLQGNFVYAFNVSSAGAAGKAGDADFTADNAPGIKVTAPNDIPTWDTPDFGTTANDLVLDKVMQSIRYGPTMQVELTGLVPGSTYKLQLLFYEQCCANRGFNVYADGVLLAGDFSPPEIQGGVNNTAAGAVISAELVTQRDKLVISLTVNGRTREDLTDPNAILDGLTLEVLKAGAAPLKISTITKDLNGVNVTFASVVNTTYVLEYKASVSDATWLAGAQIKATGTTTTLTDNTAAHLSGAQGFWRVRSQ